MPRNYLPDTLPGNEKSLSELTVEAVKLYHNIIHSSPIAIAVIKGKNMVVTLANDACLQLWGADKSIIGKSLYETLPDLMAQADHILQDIYQTGKPFFGNEIPYVVNRNGTKQTGYFDFVWQAKLDDEGKVEGITAIATEVTERALANKKIKENREQLHCLANTMPQVVWMAGPDGQVFYYNDRIDLYHGAQQSTNGSWSWQGILHSDDLEPTSEAWTTAVAKATVYEKEHRLLMKNGDYRWHLSRAVPQKDDTGKVLGWFGTATDIHQQKTFAEKLEAEVVKRTAELQKAVDDLSDQKKKDEKKNEFISIASHELKTPLTIAKGFLDVATEMLDEKADADLQLMIQKANTALSRLNNIIGDFLDVNKMQHGKLLLNHRNFDFYEMLRETVEYIRRVFPSRTLVVNGLEGNLIVEGDDERLRHVCSNLLNNAIKYSPAGTPVELNTNVTHNEVVVEIKDRGMGISPEDIPFIFNRYFRVKDVMHSHQGMGIGLYLSAEIIQRHNGKIWVNSEKGTGSSFYFSVPLIQKQQ